MITKEQKNELFEQFINLKYTSNTFINNLNITKILSNFGFKYNLCIIDIVYINIREHSDISFTIFNEHINEKIFFKYKKEIRKRKLNNILK